MKCRLTSKQKRREDDMSRLDRIVNEKAKEAVLELEIKRSKAFDAVVLMTIRELLGFGKERLEKFYATFLQKYDDVMDKYGLTDAVIVKLKDDTGVDMDDLYARYIGEETLPNAQREYEEKIEYLEKENKILQEQVETLRKIVGVIK